MEDQLISFEETILEKNKLIANFMRWKEQTDPTERWFGSFREPIGMLHKNTTIEPLLFHSDWNWLMPVIEKMLDISLNLDTMEMYYNITDCIPNITQTHIAIVDFIKWYNKQNNEKRI